MKLKLGIQRVDNIVFGRVLEQDESLRNHSDDDRNLAVIDGGVVTGLMSCEGPELSDSLLYVRGDLLGYDNNWFAFAYENVEDAEQAVTDIKALVAKVNAAPDSVTDEPKDFGLEIIE